MSFLCRVVIGYFDPESAIRVRTIVPEKAVATEEVSRLESVCNDLFGRTPLLADHLTSNGLLVIESTVIKYETQLAACVAYEVFGMSAIDQAHRSVLFPRPERHQPSKEWYAQIYRGFVIPAEEEERIQNQAMKSVQEDRARVQAEEEMIARVRAFAGRIMLRR